MMSAGFSSFNIEKKKGIELKNYTLTRTGEEPNGDEDPSKA